MLSLLPTINQLLKFIEIHVITALNNAPKPLKTFSSFPIIKSNNFISKISFLISFYYDKIIINNNNISTSIFKKVKIITLFELDISRNKLIKHEIHLKFRYATEGSSAPQLMREIYSFIFS